MAIRFIDTSFYKSPFVRSLKGSLKGLYNFVICDCNGAGIWTADFQIASLYIGFEISKDEFENSFLNTGKAICLENGKYFFPDFIEHQYPKGLSETNPAHKNFIAELRKYSLIDDDLKPLVSPLKGSNVIVMVKAMVLEKEKVMVRREKNELIFPFTGDEFLASWEILVKSQKWRKKESSALQASLKKLSKETETDAITMINNCIAGGWMGLVDLKPHEKQTQVKKESRLTNTINAHNEAMDDIENKYG